MTPHQGDVVWMEHEAKRRPVLVVTRTRAIPVLNRVVVAPITSNVRGIPTEVVVDESHGLRSTSAAAFDNLRVVPKSFLTERVGSLSHPHLEICRALGALADC